MTPRRLYQRLLILLPRRLRDEHAAEMEEAFLDALAQAAGRGRAAVAFTWMRGIADVMAVSMGRRLRSRSALPSRSRYRMRPISRADFTVALRTFRRQPASAALVVGMLALGIAANVVVFSLMNGLFLKPLPFPAPGRLVYINEKAPTWNLESTGINFPDYAVWRAASTAFDGIALYGSVALTVSDGSGAERIEGAQVTHDFADVLGVSPIAGRMLSEKDDTPGAARVAVISERLWRDRFGANPDLTGRTIRLNGVSMDVVGVLPHAAQFPDTPQVWIAIQGNPNATGTNYSFSGIGRLKAGVSMDHAQQDLLRAHAAVWNARDKEKAVSPYVQPLRERFVGNIRSAARALSAGVTLLLIVTCANVAAVMLARASARRREIGIRLAVGASRGHLVRQLLVENLLLACAGGALGLALGRWLFGLLLLLAQPQLPPWVSFSLDIRVGLFAILITLATAVLFGWAPALQALRGDVRSAMHDAVGGTTASPSSSRTLTWLVAAEFALAAVLLVSGGLLWRAFDRVKNIDPGFDTSSVLTFTVGLPPAAYRDNAARLAFWSRALDRLRNLPGVQTAGIVNCAPLSNCHTGNFFNVEGRRPLGPDEPNPVVLARVASDGYLEAMGIRLAAGRPFTAAEAAQANTHVVIVNETFVKTFWPGVTPEQAIGRRLSFNGDTPQWMSVIGVTRDIKHYGLEQPMRPGLYHLPSPGFTRATMTVALRTHGDPEALTPAVRAAFRELDPSLALYRMRPTSAMVSEGLRSRRLYSWMLGVFALLALALVVGGTYGVTSYLVSQRRREIGIRVAIGAGQRDIVRGILLSSSRAVLPAVCVGLVLAVLLARQMGDLLFGVSPREPRVLIACAAVLVLVAIAANLLPARRAARADLIASLRT